MIWGWGRERVQVLELVLVFVGTLATSRCFRIDELYIPIVTSPESER